MARNNKIAIVSANRIAYNHIIENSDVIETLVSDINKFLLETDWANKEWEYYEIPVELSIFNKNILIRLFSSHGWIFEYRVLSKGERVFRVKLNEKSVTRYVHQQLNINPKNNGN
jgi:hypothetical protein